MIIFIIPAYNEEKNIESLLHKMQEQLSDKAYFVIIVNDGSIDKTKEIAEQFSETMPIKIISHEKNLGVGAAFRNGFNAALEKAQSNDIIVTKEADNTSDLSILDTMIEEIEKGADIVLASCYAPEGDVVGASWYRSVLSWGANKLVKLIVPIEGINTFSSFYRAHNAKFLGEVKKHYGDQLITEKGFACVIELLIKFSKLKPRVTEVPMILVSKNRQGNSKMKIGKTILEYLRLFVRNF
jgi:dolichol-phosphate mannosyltransferase